MKIFEVTGDVKFDTMMDKIVSQADQASGLGDLALMLKIAFKENDQELAEELQELLEHSGVFYEQYDASRDKLTLSYKGKTFEI